MKVYSVDIKLAATVYVRADNAKEARRMASNFSKNCFEFRGEDISSLEFDDPRLPDVSLSPAMTGHGIWPEQQVEVVYDSTEEME